MLKKYKRYISYVLRLWLGLCRWLNSVLKINIHYKMVSTLLFVIDDEIDVLSTAGSGVHNNIVLRKSSISKQKINPQFDKWIALYLLWDHMLD